MQPNEALYDLRAKLFQAHHGTGGGRRRRARSGQSYIEIVPIDVAFQLLRFLNHAQSAKTAFRTNKR
jgi:hypothetical protein